jgi:hypothetical protein|eukprot:19182-Pelagococcus_subviridis.AAC.3
MNTVRIVPLPSYIAPPIVMRITSKKSAASCTPVPSIAARTGSALGARNTSPWTSFQPDSSDAPPRPSPPSPPPSTSSSSSLDVYFA